MEGSWLQSSDFQQVILRSPPSHFCEPLERSQFEPHPSLHVLSGNKDEIGSGVDLSENRMHEQRLFPWKGGAQGGEVVEVDVRCGLHGGSGEDGGVAGGDAEEAAATAFLSCSFRQLKRSEYLLRDKMPRRVGCANCFLRVPPVYQPCCPAPCCQGKLGYLSEIRFPNLTLRGI